MSIASPSPECREEALREARDAGHEVVYGNDWLLLLDLDSKAALKDAKALLKQFSPHLFVSHVLMTRSKSRHWHLYVHLMNPLSRMDRLFWQAALGSDRTRAGLDWIWAQRGHEEECFLVELPEAKREGVIL